MKTLPVGDCVWEIPPSEKPGMLVPARLYASEALLARMDEGVFEHVEPFFRPAGTGPSGGDEEHDRCGAEG